MTSTHICADNNNQDGTQVNVVDIKPVVEGPVRRAFYKIFSVLNLNVGLHETLALLTSQLRPDSNHKEEMGFLKDVFSEKSLSYLMKVKVYQSTFSLKVIYSLFPWFINNFAKSKLVLCSILCCPKHTFI